MSRYPSITPDAARPQSAIPDDTQPDITRSPSVDTTRHTSTPSEPHPSDTTRHPSTPSESHPADTTRHPSTPSEPHPSETARYPSTTSEPHPVNTNRHTSTSPEPFPSSPSAPAVTRPVTRSQNNIFKPKQKFTCLATVPTSTVPTTVKQAQKHKEWRDAMKLEFDALTKNRTWDLVPYDPNKNIVSCKWLFRIKWKSDGSIDRYKARLVAKGFTQRPGIDYHSTFSPVVKPTTIRIVLSVAVSRRWPLRKLDVNNAFLQGDLSEDVYMSQPPRFESSLTPTHVCKLRKATYGLKQAPFAWYTTLTTHLSDVGFVKSKSGPSLFIFRSNEVTVFILVYVDDIIVTGSHTTAVNNVIRSLASHFSIKDLGTLHYFLGIEVCTSNKGLFLNQSTYIEELLSVKSMSECKPASTPTSTTACLSTNDGASSFDSSRYRTVLGKLQYLAFTRLDISYAVNKPSHFMHCPSELH